MSAASDEMWDAMALASNELAEELGLGQEPFTPRSLSAIDRWVAQHKGPLDEKAGLRLGFFLARLLCAEHNGGLSRIRKKGHPLDGEWTVTGFSRGLANDYHVPFMVSAGRIGIDKALTARKWYEEVLREGQ
jgi:hypothetical protein